MAQPCRNSWVGHVNHLRGYMREARNKMAQITLLRYVIYIPKQADSLLVYTCSACKFFIGITPRTEETIHVPLLYLTIVLCIAYNLFIAISWDPPGGPYATAQSADQVLSRQGKTPRMSSVGCKTKVSGALSTCRFMSNVPGASPAVSIGLVTLSRRDPFYKPGEVEC